MQTTTRNATLDDLVTVLRDQKGRALDVVAPATALFSEDARLRITGTEPVITEAGVTQADGYYTPTAVADEGIANKLGVPVAYLKRLRTERPDLYDANVNGWLYGAPDGAPDGRKFFVRCFRGDDADTGIARAFLSDSYRPIDNFDVLTAALDGVREAGVAVNIVGADLTDRRMVVRVAAPQVQALAPTLLRGYRSPFTGESGSDNPTVFAGFQISNSETGGGAFAITPRLIVQVCRNGMTITKDALRSVHLGSRLDEGVIRWSSTTMERNLALVRAQTVDAVTTFLDTDYMTRVITRLEALADEVVETPDAVKTITKAAGYTAEQQDAILSHFIRGGQTTRAGVFNAATAAAQTVEDGDTAFDMEGNAVRLLMV